jgi:hypothetical protein
MKNCDVALIQEPWTYKGAIKGLREVSGELIYSSHSESQNLHFNQKRFSYTAADASLLQDLTAVKITAQCGGKPREINLGSAYLPYDGAEPPTAEELEKLVMGCRDQGTHLIIGCDISSHHTSWGSTNINNRGKSLFNYIKANGLDIMNRGNRPTFVTTNRQDVIEITIATFYSGNLIKDWHVTKEVSYSDHRYTRFTVRGIDHTVKTYRIPRRTDWESFRTDLSPGMRGMTEKINNCIDLEIVADQFQETISVAYKENCLLSVRRNNRNMSWWNQGLAEKKRRVRKLFNVAKNSGNWTEYNSKIRY